MQTNHKMPEFSFSSSKPSRKPMLADVDPAPSIATLVSTASANKIKTTTASAPPILSVSNRGAASQTKPKAKRGTNDVDPELLAAFLVAEKAIIEFYTGRIPRGPGDAAFPPRTIPKEWIKPVEKAACLSCGWVRVDGLPGRPWTMGVKVWWAKNAEWIHEFLVVKKAAPITKKLVDFMTASRNPDPIEFKNNGLLDDDWVVSIDHRGTGGTRSGQMASLTMIPRMATKAIPRMVMEAPTQVMMARAASPRERTTKTTIST